MRTRRTVFCYVIEKVPNLVTFGEEYRFFGNSLRITFLIVYNFFCLLTFEAKPRNRYKILMEELVIIITFVTMLNKIKEFVDSDINKFL